MESPYKQPKWLLISLLCISLLGIWWRIDCYQHRDWGTDEVNQYKNTIGALKPFWTRVDYCERYSFPGDYLLTYPFVQIFKTNKWGVAIPHFLFTLLGFYFLFLLCRRYLRHPLCWLMTFGMFSLNTSLIFHALELRPYSVLATLGLSTFYLMENLLNPSIPVPSWHYPLYFIFLFLSIGFHPYGLIIIVFCGFYFILKNYRREGFFLKIKQDWLFWSMILMTGLPLWVYYSSSPYALHIGEGTSEVFQFIPDPVTHLSGFLKNVLGNMTGNKFSYIFLTGIIIRFFYPPKGRLDILAFLLMIFVLPILFLLYSDVLFGYWFLQRQFIWLMALFPLFVGICWDGIFL